MKGYTELLVWQKAVDLAVAVYKLIETFPPSERYGRSSQIRREVVSVPSNIAEGSRRFSKKELAHFLTIAYGSGAEVETQIIISKRLLYGNPDRYPAIEVLLEEVMKMLNRMISSVS